jgi:dihydropteroate synthase
LKGLKEFKTVFPNMLLLGASRKKFIRNIIGNDTVFGDAAISTHAVATGVNILRVHDFKEMNNVISIAKKLYYN